MFVTVCDSMLRPAIFALLSQMMLYSEALSQGAINPHAVIMHDLLSPPLCMPTFCTRLIDRLSMHESDIGSVNVQ